MGSWWINPLVPSLEDRGGNFEAYSTHIPAYPELAAFSTLFFPLPSQGFLNITSQVNSLSLNLCLRVSFKGKYNLRQKPQSRGSPMPGHLVWRTELRIGLGTPSAPWPGCPWETLSLNDCTGLLLPCLQRPPQVTPFSHVAGGERRGRKRTRFVG